MSDSSVILMTISGIGGGDGDVDELSEEAQDAIRLFKTGEWFDTFAVRFHSGLTNSIFIMFAVCAWCTSTASMANSRHPLKPDFFKIFPLLCSMENYDRDEELKSICAYSLSQMCYAVIPMAGIPVVLDAFDKVRSIDIYATYVDCDPCSRNGT